MRMQREEPSADRGGPGDAGERGFASPVDLGDHVASVVASAQQAAEQIRAVAVAEAERIRTEAADEANARIEEATRDAEKMRTDSGVYSREVRQEADAYAAEKRSEADAYVSRVRAEAEEAARQTREAADQYAQQSERDARRRRKILSSEMERFDERLRTLHTVFQGMMSQLETLLPEDEPREGEQDQDDSMEESLKQGAAERAAS